MESRPCVKCNEVKPLDQYDAKASGLYGKRADCKACVRVYQANYRKLNSEVIKERKRTYAKTKPHMKRRSYLMNEYGISLSDYEEMYARQSGKCDICKSDRVGNTQHKHLHVDHCHITSKIRGLLCSQCNSGLGYFKDSESTLLEAIEYLKKSRACEVT